MRNHRYFGGKLHSGKEAVSSPCEPDHRCTGCVPRMNLHGRRPGSAGPPFLLQPDVLAGGSAKLTPAQGESQPPQPINLAGTRIRRMVLEDSPASITSPSYHPALL